MTVADTLLEWKQLATTAAELNRLRGQLAEVEETYAAANRSFDDSLEGLDEPERQAIREIMSVYEQLPALASKPAADDAGRRKAVAWLLNKVGNEGTTGIKMAELADVWEEQFPAIPSNALFATVNQHPELFARDAKEGVLRLTPDGQSRFLGTSDTRQLVEL